ncbi:hypothetical protein GJ744_008827 [Endocarpon pusillum]|uniref:Uncharacterized protein n=1 Tax=Endocarpon pusillum TaxID=364733 RepID=A0A8H7AQK9_9EURO|nr:hypothetical protein GJ744_008827 [Endocarpon pusillum]
MDDSMAEQEDLPFCDYIPPLLFPQPVQEPAPQQQQQQLQGAGDQGHELSSDTNFRVPSFTRPSAPQLLRQRPSRLLMDPDIHEYAQSAISRSEEAERQNPPRPHQQREEAPQPPSKKPQLRSKRSLSLSDVLPQQNKQQSEKMSPQGLLPQPKPVAESRTRGSTSLKLKQAVQRVRSKKESKPRPGLPQTATQLENSWARMYVENSELRRLLKKKESAIKKKEAQVQHNESLLEKASDTVAQLHHQNMQLHRRTARTTPQLRDLEDALSDNMSQFSLMQEEIQDESARNTDLIQRYAAARREATDLRCLNNTLVNNLSEERRKVSTVEAQLERMKLEVDSVVEERLRFAVLEAENEALRNDLTLGMEQMMELARIQQQMSMDLNSEDADAEDDLRREEEAKLEPWLEDPYSVPKEIKMRFRRDSIWDSLQAGPRREEEVYANAGIDMADRGTQTTPPSSPFLGASPVAVLATTTPCPPPSLTAPVVSIDSPRRSPPPSPPLLLLTAATPPFPPADQQRTAMTPTTPTKPPSSIGTQTHTNTYIHPPPDATHTQTQTHTTKKSRIFPRLPLPLPSTLRQLLPPPAPVPAEALFLALCANRLKVEREMWRTANEVAREKVVQWNTERWGGRVGSGSDGRLGLVEGGDWMLG